MPVGTRISIGKAAGILASIAILGLSAQTQPGQLRTPAQSDALLQQARSLLDQSKLADAERAARLYLDTEKQSSDGHYLLGAILFREQRPKESLAQYTEGAKYHTPSATDLKVVASDYVLLADYMDADKWFSKALEWNPNDALGWYYLGRTKYNENRFDEAVAAFKKCLDLDPRNVKAEDNLGLSLEGLDRQDEALAAYKTAIEWQQGQAHQNPGPYLDLGILLVETNQPRQALLYLAKANQLSPNDYKVHRQLGKAYTHLDQLDKARDELETAIRLAPRNASLHFMLAQVYRRQGMLDKAKEESRLYMALNGSRSTDGNTN